MVTARITRLPCDISHCEPLQGHVKALLNMSRATYGARHLKDSSCAASQAAKGVPILPACSCAWGVMAGTIQGTTLFKPGKDQKPSD